jgi:preprotein translocase subunit YajC
MILIMALPLLLVLLTSRSQSKKQKKLEESLKVGDRVVTRSGLIGRLTEVGERTAKLDIAPGVTVQMLKTAIEGVDTPPAAKTADAKDGADKGGAAGKDKESAKDRAQEKKA